MTWFQLILILSLSNLHPAVYSACYGRNSRWSIGLLYGHSPMGPFSTCLGLNHSSCVQNPVITCNDIADVNASFVADPFLHIAGPGEPWYLFYEVYNFDRKLGEIGCSVSRDMVRLRMTATIYLCIHVSVSFNYY
jgi:hypothetical protein